MPHYAPRTKTIVRDWTRAKTVSIWNSALRQTCQRWSYPNNGTGFLISTV